MQKITLKQKILILIKSLFTAYALLIDYNYIELSSYNDNYLHTSISAIMDVQNFQMILTLIMSLIFYIYTLNIADQKEFHLKNRIILASFFSFCSAIGKACSKFNTITPLLKDFSNFGKMIISFVGFTFLFENIILIAFIWLTKAKKAKNTSNSKFWKNNVFTKSFTVIFLTYLPFLILSYPGNMCWDALVQIEQVLHGNGYSLHHPIISTLIMGNIVKLGYLVTGSYNLGLFFYILVQTSAFSAALAYTLRELAYRNLEPKYLWALLGFYCFSPVFSNITSTVIKDVPFCASVIFFMVFFVRVMDEEHPSTKTWINLSLSQIGVILLRNNGLPLILLTDLGCLIYFFVSKNKRTVKMFLFGICSIIVAEILVNSIAWILHAQPGSKGEMLSLPFQQTAKYLQLYSNELTINERKAIENILGNVDVIADAYNPAIADPVKQHFIDSSNLNDIANYLKVWAVCFFKHPLVYFDAFLVHVYGWFDPGVNNAIRYECNSSIFSKPAAFRVTESILKAYYNILDKIAPIGMLQNVSLAVWLLFLLAYCERNLHMSIQYRIMNLPLWISLLICMASPCFLLHPRYGFPILFTIPFLYGIFLSSDNPPKR